MHAINVQHAPRMPGSNTITASISASSNPGRWVCLGMCDCVCVCVLVGSFYFVILGKNRHESVVFVRVCVCTLQGIPLEFQVVRLERYGCQVCRRMESDTKMD